MGCLSSLHAACLFASIKIGLVSKLQDTDSHPTLAKGGREDDLGEFMGRAVYR